MTMDSLKISIVIPAYNAGGYLTATLSSIKNQDYDSVEVIVIDGGSSDNTRSIIEEFHGLISVFISEPDKGQLHAVQKGIAKSTGDILHWLNADDIMMPGTLAYVAECFRADAEVDLVYSDDFAFEEHKRKLWVGPTIRGLTYKDHLLFYRQMYSECVFWRSSKTRLLDDSSYSLRIYTDYAFFLNLRRGLNTLWVSKRLGAFRVRDGQMSQAFAQKKEQEFAKIRQCAVSINGWSAADVARLRRFHWMGFMIRQIMWPRGSALSRRLWRLLTLDRKRKLQKTLFFDQWLSSRLPAEQKIHEILRR